LTPTQFRITLDFKVVHLGRMCVVHLRANIDRVRIERGKLIEHWGGPDLFSLLSQLGAVVSAGPEKT
jgi:hypothetical protein